MIEPIECMQLFNQQSKGEYAVKFDFGNKGDITPTKTRLTMSLPKIGDKLIRLMTSNNRYNGDFYNPEPCEVTYVNEKKGWYEVLFTDSKIKECYSVPTFDHSILKDTAVISTPVLCVETGMVYSSISECAKDMNLEDSGICRQISGYHDYYKGYHFDTVL